MAIFNANVPNILVRSPTDWCLLVALVTNMDTGILFFFFGHLKETGQPIQKIIDNLQAGDQRVPWFLCVGFLSVEGIIHFAS
jgi:hypothetical protein